MNRPKKRLELMPEVLPVPTRQTAANPSVRSRTLGHMHRMIAAAGAVAGCTRPVTQPDNTITIPPAPSTSAADTASVAIPTPPTVPTPTPTPPPVPTPPSTGYLVVDMLPSPARCFGVAASMTAASTWKSDGSGLYLEVVVTRPSGTTATLDPKAVSAWGGTLMSATGTPSQVTIKVRPLPGNTYLGASIDVACGPSGGSQTGTIIAGVNLPSVRKAGDKTPVSLMDR